MKKVMTTNFIALVSISIILSSCGNKTDKATNESSNTTVTEETKKVEVPKTDEKAVIKAIAGKYYIPTDETKSDLIFFINQNLNLELVNYKGSFEGKYGEGKIHFDDKNATAIEFSLKGENPVLKNDNEVSLEFREATDEELLVGTWYYDLGGSPLRMTFDKAANWSVPDDPFGTRKGQFKKIGAKKFTVPKYTVGITANLSLKSPTSFLLTWESGGPFGVQKLNHKKAQKSKMQSLKQLFN
jgi:hypothetical protein